VAPAAGLALYDRMLRELAAKRLPPRRPRSNPRMVNHTQSNFKRKRAEHFQSPVPQRSFRDAVVIQPPPLVEMSHEGPELDTGSGVAVQHHVLGVI